MSTPLPTLQLLPLHVSALGQYFRDNPTVALAEGLVVMEAGGRPQNPLTRTYHLGTAPTPGRGYDDRLTVRLGLSRSKLMEELELWRAHGGRKGGLRHRQGGAKYWVSEQACREWYGDTAQAA